MPTIRKEEITIDTSFEPDAEKVGRIQNIFNNLKNEADLDPEAAKIIRVEAKNLARLLGDE
jgi:hypothetical protein